MKIELFALSDRVDKLEDETTELQLSVSRRIDSILDYLNEFKGDYKKLHAYVHQSPDVGALKSEHEDRLNSLEDEIEKITDDTIVNLQCELNELKAVQGVQKYIGSSLETGQGWLKNKLLLQEEEIKKLKVAYDMRIGKLNSAHDNQIAKLEKDIDYLKSEITNLNLECAKLIRKEIKNINKPSSSDADRSISLIQGKRGRENKERLDNLEDRVKALEEKQ